MRVHHHAEQKNIFLPIIITIIFLAFLGIIVNKYQTKIKQLEQKITELEQQTNNSTSPNQNTEESVTQTSVYENSQYHYSLQYPSNLEIKTINGEVANIGLLDPSISSDYMAGKTSLHIRQGKKTNNIQDNVEEIVFNLVKPLCDADGRGASISCPRKKDFQSLVLPSGLPAYTLTLEQDTRTVVPEVSVITDEKIFYVIDLTTDNIPTFLTIYPIGDGTDQLAKQIALTTTKTK